MRALRGEMQALPVAASSTQRTLAAPQLPHDKWGLRWARAVARLPTVKGAASAT